MRIAESEREQFTGIKPYIGEVEGAAQSGGRRYPRVGDVEGAAQSSWRAPSKAWGINRYGETVAEGPAQERVRPETMLRLFEAEVRTAWNDDPGNRKIILDKVYEISGERLPVLHSLSRWDDISVFTRERIMLALMQGAKAAKEQKKAKAALIDDYEYAAEEGGAPDEPSFGRLLKRNMGIAVGITLILGTFIYCIVEATKGGQ